MNNNLMVFENEEFGSIRTILINDEPWFVGKDVADVLGYKDTSDALKRHVEDEDKLSRGITDSGQNRQMYLINESGMYSLIFGSKLENAKKFKRWVTSEVLPSIRKEGFYANEELSRELKAIIWLDKQHQKLTKEIVSINESVNEFKEHMPLFAVECDCLNKEVKKKATECLGGYKSEAYNDKSLRSRVFADIYSEIRRQFGVTSYKGIRRVQYDKAVEIVRGHELPMLLSEDIQDALLH